MRKFLTCLLSFFIAACTFSPVVMADNLNDFEFDNVPPLIQEYLGSSKLMTMKKLKRVKKMMDKYHNDEKINDYTYNLINQRLEADIQAASIELRNPIDSINYGEANSGVPEESSNTSFKVNKVKFESKKQKNEKLIKEREEAEKQQKEQEEQ